MTNKKALWTWSLLDWIPGDISFFLKINVKLFLLEEVFPMMINHNLSALNTYRKLVENNQKSIKSMEKLSSGLRINRAGDDAAGLAISEKMRAQMRGLQQAERNVQDGVSLVQTAESGLANIHEQLLRARELAVQAGNDTLTSDDRNKIQLEIDQMKQGIDSIANNTEFNGIQLLNREGLQGEASSGNSDPSFNYQNTLSLAVDSKGNFALSTNEGYPGTTMDDNQILIYENAQGFGTSSDPQVLIDGVSYELKSDPTYVSQPTSETNGIYTTVYSINNVEVTQTARIVQDKYEFEYTIKNNDSVNHTIGFYFHMDTMLGNDDHAPFIVNNTSVFNEEKYTSSNLPDSFTVYNNAGNPDIMAHGIINGSGIIEAPDEFRIGEYSTLTHAYGWADNNNPIGDSGYALLWSERSIAGSASFAVNTYYGIAVPPTISDLASPTATKTIPCDIQIQAGANSGETMKIQLSDVRTTALAITDLSVNTHENAETVIEKVDEAIQKVSSERGKYGAYQNRLDHIYNNLTNYDQNLTDTESRIRDLDVAKESIELTKTELLVQTAQAFLAQSNQMPEDVLQLLK